MLDIKNIACDRQNKQIFNQLNFKLAEGECLILTGANGSGKSSLLKMLAGLLQPIQGEIFWKQTPISQQEEYRNNLHYISHQLGIKKQLSVLENLTLMQSILCVDQPKQLIDCTLKHYQLDSIQQQLASTLSAGQQRRLALARLMLLPKKIWLLDEPLTALDDHIQKLFTQHLEQHLKNKGMAIISSHHEIELTNMPTKKIHLGQSC